MQTAAAPGNRGTGAKEPSSSTFVDNKGMVCIEGPARALEAAVATKKASPLGGLYNSTYARSGLTCDDRGYSFKGDEDECFVGIQTYYRSEVGKKRFKQMEGEALQVYQTTYSIDAAKASALAACTCHPESPIRARMSKICEHVNQNTVGSWVHRNPKSGKTLVCDQGPFEYAMRALATLKSSPLLPMHKGDQIAPVSCAAQGFPLMYGATDHCYPHLHMWTRTEQPRRNCPPGGLGKDNPDCDDWGVVESGMVERVLVAEGGFKGFAKAHGLTAVLDYWPACNCRADSMVVMHERKTKGADVCKPLESHSPVRDHWMG